MTQVRYRPGILALILLLVPGLASASTPTMSFVQGPYELVLLADAETGDMDEGTKINASGTILGTSCSSMLDCHPIVWTVSGEALEVTIPRYRDTWLPDINDDGLIVGSIEVEPDLPVPALWLDADEYTILRTPDNSPGMALVINNRNQVAGIAMQPNGAMRLVRWTNHEPSWLEQPADPVCSLLLDMNDSGVMVGQSSPDCEIMQAATWDNDGLTLLPSLNTDATPDPDDWLQWQSSAWAINESGTIVGFALDTGGQYAVTWQDGEISRLNGVSDAVGCAAFGLNDGGTIVGQCFTEMAASIPVAWIDGQPVELPGGEGIAYDINNDGIIAGHVGDEDVTRAVMWVPARASLDADTGPEAVLAAGTRLRAPGRLASTRSGR
jgi:uncharacterized membrane protein